MNPTHATQRQELEDDSDGEEEIISTWKVTNPGKITVVPKATERLELVSHPRSMAATMTPQQASAPMAPSAGINSQRNMRPKPSAPPTNAGQCPQSIAPAPATTQAIALSAPRPAMKAIWYLGGNHVVKLLTSVDGDLDPLVLSKLEAVPSVVGELALSVESLVSDDFTVGGFESDLLAKIAANTLAAKRASSVTLAPKTATLVHVQHQPTTAESKPASEHKAVPNPLAAQNPVPNPLARITPPGSPSVFTSENSNKRKAPTTNEMRKTKTARSDAQTPLIQAR